MTKPRFHILCWGPVVRSEPGSEAFSVFAGRFPRFAGTHSVADAKATVGLVAYDAPEGERFMMLDLGMAVQWPEIANGLQQYGCNKLGKITHVLQTHWDEDHFENITRLSSYHPICVWGGSGPLYAPQNGRIFILGTGYYVETESIYPNGSIEDPAITFHYAFRAHSRDEMYFIIDSANAGKVAFIGDLIHSPITEQPIEFIVGRDRLYTLDVFRKYEVLRRLLEDHPDVETYYCGHARAPLTRSDVVANVAAMEGPEYRKLFEEVLDAGHSTLNRYQGYLAAMQGDIRPVLEPAMLNRQVSSHL